MSLLKCHGFLFDMDGVLVDSRAVVERTWQRWAERRGFDADAIVPIAHGRRASDTLRDIAPHLDIAAETAWIDEVERNDLEGVVAMPGAAALLAHLPGLAWAIVTSCSDALARARLAACGLPIPRVLIAAERIGAGKPAPDGYLAGARALGIAPAECVVFEDAPPGIQAGLVAGARVVGLATTYPAERLTDATRIVRDLTEVRIGRDHGAQPVLGGHDVFHVLLGG
ncbi:MAG TPA: HAD-IA family hydrolase [Gemmatimonadaceae bacterium]|nr:HAD-IA family hydrolase [Gemmatimonadaceae bacterium]